MEEKNEKSEVSNVSTISTKIVQISQYLHQKNMLAAADGNISYRLSDEQILITPSGVAKAFMSPESMAIITLSGKVIAGHPSSESAMHLAIYQNCEKAKAVVHAHPPTVIAWSIARPDLKYMPNEGLSELIIACGNVPFVEYARPGTSMMGEHLKKYLPQHRALILSRHGAVCWGESLEEAYGGMERIEHSAIILAKAQSLGGITSLPRSEVEALFEIRRQMGERLL